MDAIILASQLKSAIWCTINALIWPNSSNNYPFQQKGQDQCKVRVTIKLFTQGMQLFLGQSGYGYIFDVLMKFVTKKIALCMLLLLHMYVWATTIYSVHTAVILSVYLLSNKGVPRFTIRISYYCSPEC